MPIELHSETEINCVVVLQSLTPDEPRTGANVFKSTIGPICERDGQVCEFHEPRSPAELVAILKQVEGNCTERGWMPIVHLDTHGDDIDGLKIEPSGEFISWEELGGHLRRINRACANRLVAVVAACFGMHALSAIANREALDDVSPFYALVGPNDVVSAPTLEEAMVYFYRSALNGTSITDAVAARKPPLYDFLSESILINAVLRHLRDRCMGEGLQRRIERLTGVAIAQDRIESRVPQDTRQMLQAARRALQAENFDLEKYKRRFLMADHPRNSGRFRIALPELLDELGYTPR